MYVCMNKCTNMLHPIFKSSILSPNQPQNLKDTFYDLYLYMCLEIETQ